MTEKLPINHVNGLNEDQVREKAIKANLSPFPGSFESNLYENDQECCICHRRGAKTYFYWSKLYFYECFRMVLCHDCMAGLANFLKEEEERENAEKKNESYI